MMAWCDVVVMAGREVGFGGCVGKPFTADGLKQALMMAMDRGSYFMVTAE
jgi:hypothetical protein